MDINNFQQLKDYILSQYPKEACGLLVDNTFIPVDNISETPETDFEINSIEYTKYDVQAIIHSHIVTRDSPRDEFGRMYDPRTPSMQDMQGQIITAKPWGILATDGENVTDPIFFGKSEPDPLYERPFIHNIYDCYEAIRDWYKINSSIRMSSYPRPIFWFDYNPNFYEKYYKDEGFVRVEKGDEQFGDMVYFKIKTNYVNHAGIYLGDNTFFHHLYGRLSGDDNLSKWYKQYVYACRNPQL